MSNLRLRSIDKSVWRRSQVLDDGEGYITTHERANHRICEVGQSFSSTYSSDTTSPTSHPANQIRAFQYSRTLARMSINILVVGATGKQGGAAIATLFEQKNPAFQLSFLTRKTDSSSARKLAERGATPHQGDLSDPASLKRALQGVDRAFLVTDLSAGEQAEVVQGKNFIDAAKAAGIQHLVFTSVSGADEADNVPHFRSKYQASQRIHLQCSTM